MMSNNFASSQATFPNPSIPQEAMRKRPTKKTAASPGAPASGGKRMKLSEISNKTSSKKQKQESAADITPKSFSIAIIMRELAEKYPEYFTNHAAAEEMTPNPGDAVHCCVARFYNTWLRRTEFGSKKPKPAEKGKYCIQAERYEQLAKYIDPVFEDRQTLSVDKAKGEFGKNMKIAALLTMNTQTHGKSIRNFLSSNEYNPKGLIEATNAILEKFYILPEIAIEAIPPELAEVKQSLIEQAFQQQENRAPGAQASSDTANTPSS